MIPVVYKESLSPHFQVWTILNFINLILTLAHGILSAKHRIRWSLRSRPYFQVHSGTSVSSTTPFTMQMRPGNYGKIQAQVFPFSSNRGNPNFLWTLELLKCSKELFHNFQSWTLFSSNYFECSPRIRASQIACSQSSHKFARKNNNLIYVLIALPHFSTYINYMA